MPKFVFMPPQDDERRLLAARLAEAVPEYHVASPETDEEALAAIRDADAVYGWVPPAALAVASKLAWVQNPDAGPFYGYYYPELIRHPLVICNPRGIYNDHISHHILMFVLALSRGLPWYLDAQRNRVWNKDARQTPYLYLGEATALINGVGGIGHETARLCNELGMAVIGIEPRPEHRLPYVEFHAPDELDDVLPGADFVITTVPIAEPAHAGDRVHVQRRPLQTDEADRVLHQHRPRHGVQDRRPRRRGRVRRDRGRRAGCLRARAACLPTTSCGD